MLAGRAERNCVPHRWTRTFGVDLGSLNRELVLENNVVFGSVNAHRRHYQAAADSLAQAHPAWLEQLITRRVPVRQWAKALARQPHDVDRD